MARRLQERLNTGFGKNHTVKMTEEPVAAQASQALTGNLFSSEANAPRTAPSQGGTSRDEHFFVEFQITEGRAMKYLAKMKLLTDRMPRITVLALAAIARIAGPVRAFYARCSRGALDDAQTDNQRLTREIAQAQHNLSKAKGDYQFILDNKDVYDSLLKSDRLDPPHPPRGCRASCRGSRSSAASRRWSYSFAAAGDQSLKSVTSQPTSGQYHVSVENIELKVGAPLDTQIFDFVLDLAESFPGAAVVQYVEMRRAPEIGEGMLDNVSQGQESGIVSGDIKVTWRTAQANEPDKKGK